MPLKSLNNCGASNPIRLFSEGDGFTVRFYNDSLSECVLPLHRVAQHNLEEYEQVSESGIEAGMSTSHQLTKEMYQSYTDVCFDLPFKIKEIDGHGNPEISCLEE
jgi:hypothetical protein